MAINYSGPATLRGWNNSEIEAAVERVDIDAGDEGWTVYIGDQLDPLGFLPSNVQVMAFRHTNPIPTITLADGRTGEFNVDIDNPRILNGVGPLPS